MKINNETKIGILVVGVLGVLVILTVRAGDFHVVKKGYEMKAHFHNIDGVELNAPVMLNGLEVGQVKVVNILYGEETIMEVTLWLNEEAKLREGARAYVKNMGLLGEKYVGLTAGEKNAAYLPPGSVIMGIEPGSLEKIFADGEVIAANLKEISQEINERLKVNNASIDEIIANIKVASKNIASISDNVNQRLAVNDKLIDDLVSNLNLASKNLEELSYDLKINPWKLMYKAREKRDKKAKND